MSRNDFIGNVKIWAAVVLAAVFIIGAASGAALWHTIMAPLKMPQPMYGPIPMHLLDLSDDQQQKVREIFEAHRPDIDKVISEAFPKVRVIIDEIDREVSELLTPEQRKSFENIKAKRPKGPPHSMLPPGPSDGPPMPMFPPPGGAPPGPQPWKHGPGDGPPDIGWHSAPTRGTLPRHEVPDMSPPGEPPSVPGQGAEGQDSPDEHRAPGDSTPKTNSAEKTTSVSSDVK